MTHHLAILSLTGPYEGLRLSKLNSADHQKIQKIAHKGLFSSPQSNPAAAIAYGKRVNCFEVTAGSCRSDLYFTASEKENLRTESYSYKDQKLSQCTGKQNYAMKNEKL